MPTLNHALAAFEGHLGFPQSRSRTIARRLQEAGTLPLGVPAAPPQIDRDHFVALFLAVAADCKLHEALAAVAALLACAPGGVSLEGAPLSLCSARSELLALVETAIEDPDDLRQIRIEVVANWPEIAIHAPHEVRRYQPVGTTPGHWQATGHRRSTTVDGRAFRDAVRALFH